MSVSEILQYLFRKKNKSIKCIFFIDKSNLIFNLKEGGLLPGQVGEGDGFEEIAEVVSGRECQPGDTVVHDQPRGRQQLTEHVHRYAFRLNKEICLKKKETEFRKFLYLIVGLKLAEITKKHK